MSRVVGLWCAEWMGKDEAGSYLRPIDFCFTQLKAQGPSRTCNESKEEERKRKDQAVFDDALWDERLRVERLRQEEPRQDIRPVIIDNLLVRIHFSIVMIRWTGLAPWEFGGWGRPVLSNHLDNASRQPEIYNLRILKYTR